MRNFKVYKSSAGSGKTFTLVKEYLKLCLQAESPFGFSKILAITFTNKASQEMKERILLALDDISSEGEITGTSMHLKKALMLELNLTPSDLQFKCKQIQTSILHNYADFNVSTIDRFSHKLIRTFAKDLGLNINFKVDLDVETLLETVVATVISLVGIKEDVSNLIIDHSSKKVSDGKSWNPSKELLDVAKTILADDGIIRLKELNNLDAKRLLQIQREFYSQDKAFKSAIIPLAEDAISLIEKNGLNGKFRYHSQGGLPSYFKKVAAFNYSEFVPGQRVLDTIEEDKWEAGKLTELEKTSIESIKADLTDLYKAIQVLVEAELESYFSRKLISKNLNLIALLQEIALRFDALKKEKGLVPISDFNKKIAEVVLTEPMPFIYERLGERFDHIMIDEFQDTSVMQFMNLLPLAEESLARGKFNMIVGDAKQAIYRFRGGEVEQFSEMPEYIPEKFSQNDLVLDRLVNLKSHYTEEPLNFNFRSTQKVIEFNNQFFKNIQAILPEKVQTIFTNHEQQIPNMDDRGFVKVQFLSKDEYDDETVSQVESQILNCLNDGYVYKDIAILCRTKKQAVKVSEFLKLCDVPLLSSESLLLSEFPEVQLLVAASKWLLNESDLIAQKDVLAYLINSNKIDLDLDETLQEYIRGKKSIVTLLLQNGINIDFNSIQSKSVYEIYESLIRVFNFNDKFNVYIQFFQESVFNFSAKESSSLQDFLQWWETKADKLSISVPEGLNAVQVLTVHKSKGLEFPVVIYPFADQTISPPGTDFLWVDSKEVHEDLKNSIIEYKKDAESSLFSEAYNLEKERKIMDLVNDTYVAFTRASERLYVSCRELPKKAGEITLPQLLKSGLLPFGYSDGVFEFGKTETKDQQEVSEDIEFNLTYQSAPWDSKIRLSLDSHKKWDIESSQDARQFGNLFHEIMAQINSELDIEPVLKRYLFKGILTLDEKEDFKAQIHKIVTDDRCKKFFNPQISNKREATLLLSDGNILRPDRVVFFENRVAVLDYKTGEQNEAHQKQIYNYMNWVSETTKLPVEGYLYYLDNSVLQKVS